MEYLFWVWSLNSQRITTHTHPTQKIGPSLGKVQELSYVMKKFLMYIQSALSGANPEMTILRGLEPSFPPSQESRSAAT